MSDLTNELLSQIQKNFPLCRYPYKEIASRVGVDEQTVLEILKKEKENSIIRQISPIFDTKKLGYKSSLVAFKVADQDIEKATKIINSHPGVSHNYERDHDFNIWFTIAVSPESKIGLEKSVEILAKLSNAKESIILPTLKMFKISVKLNTTGKDAKKEKISHKSHKSITLTPKLTQIIKESQYDLPITSDPFANLVKTLNISYDELFESLTLLKDSGIMRRFAAILNHRKAGFNANAMVVWDVDEKCGEEIGKIAASFSAVSHCYLRPKYPSWQYNLFTMVHGKTKDETNSVIEEMAREIDHKSKRPLYSTREFKKVRLTYFSPKFSEWEDNHIGVLDE